MRKGAQSFNPNDRSVFIVRVAALWAFLGDVRVLRVYKTPPKTRTEFANDINGVQECKWVLHSKTRTEFVNRLNHLQTFAGFAGLLTHLVVTWVCVCACVCDRVGTGMGCRTRKTRKRPQRLGMVDEFGAGFAKQNPQGALTIAQMLTVVKKTDKNEHESQVGVFDYMRRVLPKYDRKAFAVPNGQKLAGSKGLRAATMRELKAEGLEPGVPDWQIPGLTPLGGYPGIVVEMKTAKGVVSALQWSWLLHYAAIGWLALVCRSEAEAIKAIRAVGYV